jgi:hypothetical protein
MKTNTIKINKKNFISLLGFFFIILNAPAQMQNNGPLYVGSNASVFLSSGNLSFGTLASTSTLKTGTTGVFVINAGATTVAGSTTQFVDGWVSTLGTTAFTFPIGQVVSATNYYAPVKVTPVSGSTGVSAAYFRANPTTIGQTTTLDASLTSISVLEYWKVTGSNTALTLTWNAASSISALTTFRLADISIAGYKTSTSKWEAIPSLVDVTSIIGGASTITTGSVSSAGNVTLANYSGFSIGLKGTVCPELSFTAGSALSWAGSVFAITPTLADSVTISSAGSPGSFVCNSLVLNADITLTNGQFIEVVNGITGTGKIIMSSGASLVQRATGVAKPLIELTKTTRSIRQNDYTYFGSPIVEDAFSQLASARASTAASTGAFDNKYKYVSGTGGGWQDLTVTEIGKGFIARVKAQAPFTTLSATDYVNLKFTGTANNGDITVGVVQNASNPNGGTSHNLLANPYPSAIDADVFLQNNTTVDGVIYIWKAITPNNGAAYGQADYIAYTRAGTTASSNVSSTPFAGKIASGQGFLVKALATGNITFTNCMRLTGDNNDFNRVVNETTVMDRYKVNMTGDNGVFSQIVVSYLPEGTMGYDRMYDAGRNSVSTAQLYSILENDGRKLAINARPNFINTDVVPIGVSKTGTTLENFTLSIQEKEGVFAAATPVYVHDLILNTYTDLTLSDYTFSSDSAAANNRFEIVYQNGELNNPNYQGPKAIAFIENGMLSVVASIGISSIQIFDIAGRKVTSIKGTGLTSSTTVFNFSEGIYIAKIKLENGAIATQKLINRLTN